MIQTMDRFWHLGFLAPLVSHSCAIGDTISCDAPFFCAIGFRGKFLPRCPPSKACFCVAISDFYGKKWGCSSDSLRYHRKHSATGVLLHLSRDRGGYFGQVAKLAPPKKGVVRGADEKFAHFFYLSKPLQYVHTTPHLH